MRAVISDPLRPVASTMTVPSERPLMIRLRTGKLQREGRRAGRELREDQPALLDAPKEARGSTSG